jgi:putative Holliday junction resolvase
MAPVPAASHLGGQPGRGRVLAIDYGRRRLGLAVSDALRVTAQPFATWKRSNRRRDMARLRDLCREQEIGLILVGLPLHLEGARGEMAEEASLFADGLRAETGKPVELVDERLSSWEAESARAEKEGSSGRLRAHSRHRKRQKLDEIAAAIILRDYLERESKAL